MIVVNVILVADVIIIMRSFGLCWQLIWCRLWCRSSERNIDQYRSSPCRTSVHLARYVRRNAEFRCRRRWNDCVCETRC